MSYALAIERMRAGTATIEYVEEAAPKDGEARYVVRVQFSGVGHVLTITQEQLDELKAFSQEELDG